MVFALISQSTACKLRKSLLNLIPHAAELAHDELFRTLCIRRIVEADVEALAYLAGKRRTRLVGTTADGNHIVPCFVQVDVHALGRVSGEIDTTSFITSTARGFTRDEGLVPAE